MQWLALLLAGAVYILAAYWGYSEKCRQSPWFWAVGVSLGTITTLIWFGVIKYLDDRQQIYVYSLFWDFVICSVYYFIPILFFNVRLDRWSVFGLALMMLGLIIVKVRM